MAPDRQPSGEIDAAALEAALPSLTAKLRELEAQLSDEEKVVFSSIVNSAALHLEAMQAISHTAEVRYLKPISAAATVGVRQHLLELPKMLGLTEHE